MHRNPAMDRRRTRVRRVRAARAPRVVLDRAAEVRGPNFDVHRPLATNKRW